MRKVTNFFKLSLTLNRSNIFTVTLVSICGYLCDKVYGAFETGIRISYSYPSQIFVSDKVRFHNIQHRQWPNTVES